MSYAYCRLVRKVSDKAQYEAIGSFEAAMQQQSKDLIGHVREVFGAYVKQMYKDLKVHENSWVSNGMDYAVSYAQLSIVYESRLNLTNHLQK